MRQHFCRTEMITAVTPLFAEKGLNGVSIRELAKASGSNSATISYYFGGKTGLYEAVLKEVFAGMLKVSEVAGNQSAPLDKFREYVYQCGICFHAGDGGEFIPRTVSADSSIPECPCCLNNDAESFNEEKKPTTDTTQLGLPPEANSSVKRKQWPMITTGQI
jgi:AcrR family transcriptional regulator